MGTAQTIVSVLSLVIAIIGVTAAYVYYRRSRKYLELSYEISPTLSLVSVGEAVKDRIVIWYGNEEIEDLEGIVVEIRSSGTQAVEFPQSASSQATDTQTPVMIDFGQEARIVGEPTVETNPEGLGVFASKDPENSGRIVLGRVVN